MQSSAELLHEQSREPDMEKIRTAQVKLSRKFMKQYFLKRPTDLQDRIYTHAFLAGMNAGAEMLTRLRDKRQSARFDELTSATVETLNEMREEMTT